MRLTKRFPPALALVLCATLLVAAAVVWVVTKPFASDRGRVLSVTIAGNLLHIDADYLRQNEQGRDGERSEIDVVARFPGFLPSRQGPRSTDREEEGQVVVTLMAPDDAVEPVERPAKLYSRFLEADVWTHPGGLIVRRFERGSPYENEELYMAPPEGRAFFARCMRPPAQPDGLPDTCLTEVRQAGLQALVRFPPHLLSDWQRLTEGLRGLIRSFMRPS